VLPFQVEHACQSSHDSGVGGNRCLSEDVGYSLFFDEKKGSTLDVGVYDAASDGDLGGVSDLHGVVQRLLYMGYCGVLFLGARCSTYLYFLLGRW